MTARFGRGCVPVLHRDWPCAPAPPYRKTYSLKPGESWFDAATTDKMREHYVRDHTGIVVPVGAVVARELKAEGADEAVFVEIWGGGRKVERVNQDLICVARIVGGMTDSVEHGAETVRILTRVDDRRGHFRGVPDVIAVCPDGRIAAREIKRAGKDALQPNPHDVADTLCALFGGKLDLALRPVDNYRAATTPAIRSIPAAKLARVLSSRVARLWASLIFAKKFSIRCRSLSASRSKSRGVLRFDRGGITAVISRSANVSSTPSASKALSPINVSQVRSSRSSGTALRSWV